MPRLMLKNPPRYEDERQTLVRLLANIIPQAESMSARPLARIPRNHARQLNEG